MAVSMDDELIVKEVTAMAKRDEAKFLAQNILRVKLVLHSSVDFRQFAAAAVVAANTLSRPCDPASVLIAAFNCAHIGLNPNPTLGMCYFVPRKQGTVVRCTLDIGYRGYLELAYESKFLKTVYSDVVYKGEEFDYWVDQDGPKMKHRPDVDRDLSSSVARQNVVGAYAVYTTQSGGCSVTYVNRKEIDRVDSGENVWGSNYVPMVRKTPLRRSAKLWQLTNRLAAALYVDEQNEIGEDGTIPALRHLIDRRGTLDFDNFKPTTVEGKVADEKAVVEVK